MFEYRDHTGTLSKEDTSVSNYLQQDQVLNGLHADLKDLKFRLIILSAFFFVYIACAKFFPSMIFETYPEKTPNTVYTYPAIFYFLIAVVFIFMIIRKNRMINKLSNETLQ